VEWIEKSKRKRMRVVLMVFYVVEFYVLFMHFCANLKGVR